MNDLLGGPDAGEGKAVANLPKTEAQMPERARELSAGPVRSDNIWSGKTKRKQTLLPKPAKAMHAACERARST